MKKETCYMAIWSFFQVCFTLFNNFVSVEGIQSFESVLTIPSRLTNLSTKNYLNKEIFGLILKSISADFSKMNHIFLNQKQILNHRHKLGRLYNQSVLSRVIGTVVKISQM